MLLLSLNMTRLCSLARSLAHPFEETYNFSISILCDDPSRLTLPYHPSHSPSKYLCCWNSSPIQSLQSPARRLNESGRQAKAFILGERFHFTRSPIQQDLMVAAMWAIRLALEVDHHNEGIPFRAMAFVHKQFKIQSGGGVFCWFMHLP